MGEKRLFALRQTAGPNLEGVTSPPTLKLLPAEQILGRSERAELEIPVPTVSRRHAVIWLEENIPHVRDLESGHGTFVNSQRISEPTALKGGDQLGLGTEVVLVLLEKTIESPAEEALRAVPSGKISPLVELALSDGTSEERLRDSFRSLVRLQDRVRELADEASVLEAIVDELWRSVEADRVIAFRGTDPDKLEAVAWRLRRDEEDPARRPPSRSVLTRGLLASEPLITFDARSDQRFAQQASVEFSDIRSVMCVPLRSPMGPYGLLYADTLGSTGLHSGDDANLFTVVSSCAGLKLHELHQRQEISEEATPSNLMPQLKGHLSRLEILAGDAETERGEVTIARLLRAECARLRGELDEVTSREQEAVVQEATVQEAEAKEVSNSNFTKTQALTSIPDDEDD